MSTYLDYFKTYLSPKLQEIDLFLKTHEKSDIDPIEVENLLDITRSEIDQIMRLHELDYISKHSFFIIMCNGSSDICQLFSREISRKMPNAYSPLDISYIYQIPYNHVLEATEKARIDAITTDNLNELFSYIIL
ncbi:hypothetical protein HZI73_05325 [Vallitalea pronyensis]|uniref:Uncharacterized protein n=1 Tax=Vallitalea pronyensis TaxID=1348613 RepID=A0A8J8SFW0_9FIRM|nr:hypothetical protein [Vallitalea pronyensis]QUI21747.1 hypothetical protein HZI73_05325 [Vallitalea pronyensis]